MLLLSLTQFNPVQYYGVPFSVDMGLSAWDNQQANINKQDPLPLIHTKKGSQDINVVDQPTNLNLLSDRYAEQAMSFIGDKNDPSNPWFLYLPFNHVHVPDNVSEVSQRASMRLSEVRGL